MRVDVSRGSPLTDTLSDAAELRVLSKSHSFPIDHVLNLIHGQFRRMDMSVKVLKHDCDIRDNNFSSIFKREIGMTIKEYIEWLRVREACSLLDRGCITIVEVGYEVGYEHVQTFYRVFRRRLSCTPGQYLERMRQQTTVTRNGHEKPQLGDKLCA